MKRVLSLTVIFFVFLFGLGVHAGVERLTDPRDSPGDFDVASIGHRDRGDRQVHLISTRGPWRSRELRINCGRKPCRAYIDVFISTNRDADFERRVQIYWRERRLQAHLIRYRLDNDCTTLCGESSDMGEVPVWRPDHRTVAVALRPEDLGRGRTYGWRVQIVLRWWGEQQYNCRKRSPIDDSYVCDDTAPDRDYARARY